MDELIELLSQIQELAGIAIEALSGGGEGGAPAEGAPAEAPPEGGGEEFPPPPPA